MKTLSRISLFFMVAAAFFTMGIYTKDMAHHLQTEIPSTEDSYKEVAAQESTINSDTRYLIEAYDAVLGQMEEHSEEMPAKLLGLTRERCEEEIAVYAASPSLEDLEKGFLSAELISFSSDRVVVRKNYQIIEETSVPMSFYLVVENHNIIVYEADSKTRFMDTKLKIDTLPDEIQDEIINIKYIENEEELYNFLESYSS
ncbi:MAG: hypothetical protein RRX92_03040 [Lachnospiraceae bacterium]